MSKWKLITVLAVVYIVGLLILLPARVVAHFIDTPPGVRWGQVEGTLWSGSMGVVQVEDLVLRDLHWTLQPLALLTGKLQADIEVRDHPANVVVGQGRVQLGRSSLRIDAFSADARLTDLAAMSPVQSPFELQGRIDAQVNRFDWGDPLCSQLDGQLRATGVALRIGRDWQELDNFTADLSCTDGRVAAQLSPANRLGLSGNVLLDTRGMQGEVRLQPGAEAPRAIRDFVNMLPEQARQTQRFQLTF
jgi:general secretion pathway protein N